MEAELARAVCLNFDTYPYRWIQDSTRQLRCIDTGIAAEADGY